MVKDHDKRARVILDDGAFDAAIEAATEAHVAGLDPHEQLKHGIQAYLQAHYECNAMVEVNHEKEI